MHLCAALAPHRALLATAPTATSRLYQFSVTVPPSADRFALHQSAFVASLDDLQRRQEQVLQPGGAAGGRQLRHAGLGQLLKVAVRPEPPGGAKGAKSFDASMSSWPRTAMACKRRRRSAVGVSGYGTMLAVCDFKLEVHLGWGRVGGWT